MSEVTWGTLNLSFSVTGHMLDFEAVLYLKSEVTWGFCNCLSVSEVTWGIVGHLWNVFYQQQSLPQSTDAHVPHYLQSVINVSKYSRRIIIRNSLSKSWWWNRWLTQLWSWLYHNLGMESGGWSSAWLGSRLDAVLLRIMLSFRFEGFCFLERWLWCSHVWICHHKPECLVKKVLCCGHGHSKDLKLHWMFDWTIFLEQFNLLYPNLVWWCIILN